MILFVATTAPPLAGGIRVDELVIEEREVEDEDVYAVDPDIWEDLEAWLIVCRKPVGGVVLVLPDTVVVKTGAVFVRVSGPWAWAMEMATEPDDMNGGARKSGSAFKPPSSHDTIDLSTAGGIWWRRRRS
jgi:hypothetical protein